MNKKSGEILKYFALIVVSLCFFFWGLVQAQSFLMPLSVAVLLAMVALPICSWMEKRRLKRGWASLFSVLIIMSFFVFLASVIAGQMSSISEDWPQIQKKLEPKIEQLQEYVANKTGISVQEQEQKIAETLPGGDTGQEVQGKKNAGAQGSTADKNSSDQDRKAQTNKSEGKSGAIIESAGKLLMKTFSVLGNFLLTFVYVFFFLLYRRKFKLAILKMVPDDQKGTTETILFKSTEVSQNYLLGRLTLIIFLAGLYFLGLSLSGVRNALLISILAAVLSLVPYVGNIIGYVLATAMAFFSGSGLSGAVGVAITFGISQFVESYILEPYIVGDRVNLNPVVTIIVVVLGGAVWGIVGMLIAIPALGVAKVVFDNIPSLRPLGYLFGSEDISSEDDQDKDNLLSRLKGWAMQRFRN
ncbi:AI-2E family transporter [Porifericola rhodea]|uniref:AI-2E family transporter n=1 Tax=Porifericola rhodea TaxID=930972 RepID=UPI0026650BEE|nr:AI-2E family transporter [Porifericola rhodea]WKN30198.1 AI-2E family transporter [Porifericola rhodea]